MKKSENKNNYLIRNHRTLGQKAADSLAKWAGSWSFIIFFALFLLIWVGMNSYFLFNSSNGNSFDPYPFILLNLILSCLAAIQAPIILMSQNRAEEKDRQRAEYDYKIDKKAEKEIQEIKQQISRIEKILLGKR